MNDISLDAQDAHEVAGAIEHRIAHLTIKIMDTESLTLKARFRAEKSNLELILNRIIMQLDNES